MFEEIISEFNKARISLCSYLVALSYVTLCSSLEDPMLMFLATIVAGILLLFTCKKTSYTSVVDEEVEDLLVTLLDLVDFDQQPDDVKIVLGNLANKIEYYNR